MRRSWGGWVAHTREHAPTATTRERPRILQYRCPQVNDAFRGREALWAALCLGFFVHPFPRSIEPTAVPQISEIDIEE
jgi:hypothetical protein